jgi:hypothetical protein
VHAVVRARIVTGMRWIATMCCALLLACEATPDASPSNPFAANALHKSQRFSFDARVEERMPAGGYLYLHVRDLTGATHWIATLRAFAPASDAVRVRVMARAEHFRSPRLGRDFSPLLFAALSASQRSERNISP